MVERLDTDHAMGHVDVPVVDVRLERRLGIAWTSDQHLMHPDEQVGDLIEEPMVIGCMSRAGRSGLAMDLTVWTEAVNLEHLAVPDRETRDSGIPMVQPDNGVHVGHSRLLQVGIEPCDLRSIHASRMPRLLVDR